MGNVINYRILSTNWLSKAGLVPTLTLLVSLFMPHGWNNPRQAEAAPLTNVSTGTLTSGWAHPSTGTAGPWTITNAAFSCGAGSNRLLVAVVTGETGTAAAAAVTASKGTGNNFLTAVNTASSRTQVWMGFLTESQIASSGTNSIVITNASGQAWTSSDVYVACYSGVDQATPLVTGGTFSVVGTTATTSILSIAAALDGMVIDANSRGATTTRITPPAGYTEPFDLAGTGYSSGISFKAVTATGMETGTFTMSTADTRFAHAAISLKPVSVAGDTLSVGTNFPLATNASDSAVGVVMQRLKLDSNANADSQVVLNGITLDEAGTATSVANVKIYIDTVAQSTLSGSAVLIGNQPSWNGASTTVALSQGTVANRTVTAGISKYLYVVFDMASGQAGNTAQSHVSGVSVASPDTGATGLNFSSNSFTLTSGPIATITSCTGCHGYPPVDGTARNIPSGQFQGSHSSHGNPCMVCHVDNGTNLKHANGNINMAVNINNAGGAYSKGAAFAVSNAVFSAGTCSGISCHGQAAPAWGASAAAPVNGFPFSASLCDKCHSGTATAPFYSTAIPKVTTSTNAKVGAHTSHLTVPDGLATAFVCTDCHGTVALNTASHMNGTTNFIWSTLATRNGALVPAYTAATRVCSNVYCHGAGMPGGDTTGTNRAPVWNVAFLPATLSRAACASCHGFPPPSTAGHPAVTIPASWPVAGAATGALGTTCSCHANISSTGTTYANIFVNKALHINGTVDVSGGGHAVPFYAHATPPFTSCTGCHNASAAGPYPAATAGAAPNCRGCHVTADPTVTTTGCSSCHTIPPSGTAHPNILGSHTKHSSVACTTCHNGAGSGSGAAHGPGNKGANPAIDNIVFTAAQAGASATWTAATKTCSTTYCHGATVTGGTAKSPVWGTTLTGCGTCHGFPPATSTHTGVTATQCINCHPHVNAAGTGFTNAALHINNVIDASGGVPSGGTPCYTCHSVYNVMNSSTASFHHVLDDTAPDKAPAAGVYPSSQTALACTSCHTDHNYFNSSKGANLRTSYNAAAGSISNHDFSTTAPYGLCVSCHATAQTKGTAQKVAGTAATIAIDGSATGYQASMHNYTTTSLFGTSKFSANCVKCHTDEQTKDKQTSAAPHEFGTHYSAQRSLLNPMGATPQAAAGADFCYRCHSKTTDVNPGGGAAKTASLKDYFGSKAMTAASEDIFSAMQRGTATVGRHNVSSYKGLHKDDETRAGLAAAKHVECVDCHDPHLAKAGNHTAGSAAMAGVLTGASGVGVTTWGANWAGVTATAYNPSTTTATLITATAEWQVCFKCHSGANANVATWGGTAAASFTDLALEFNPNNSSGHPIVTGLNNYPNSLAPKALTAAKMKAPWNVNLGVQVMTCSDCHATDSAASKGPHGSSVKWMLTGTNKAWPYTTAAANGTSTGTLFRVATYSTGNGTVNGLFCLNCHTVTASNSWHSNSNVTGGEHGGNAIMACASCHVRVPHGGKISRLLQTTNAPARFKSNGNGATSSYTQFGPTTGTVKGSTASSSTFNSSCGEHSGSGGEAW